MAVPDFQTIFLPMLKFLSDNKEHSLKETAAYLATLFSLTDQELKEMLPVRNQTVFYNRITWAKAHLKMAGLIESTKHSHYKISPLGIDTLSKKPTQLNLNYLKQFPEYLKNSGKIKEERKSPSTEKIETKETPEEIIEHNYLKARKSLVSELLSKVQNCDPGFFETIVVQLLVKMGYGGTIKEAGKTTRLTNDGGIDGIIKEDRLGLDFVYIQAKRWTNQSIGRQDIQSFVGALDGQKANKGVFITTSRFTDTAIEYVKNITKKVILIDGEELVDFMIDYNLGVSISETYELKQIDNNFFEPD